jgi:hypothetical protein
MFILIITLFVSATAPATFTTIEFGSFEACMGASNAWAAQTKKVNPGVHFGTVCVASETAPALPDTDRRIR